MTTTIHTCPACNLRFAFVTEMIDHVRNDHRPKDPRAVPVPWGQVLVPIDPAGDNTAVLTVVAALARQAGTGVSLVGVPADGIDARGVEARLRSGAEAVRERGVAAVAWHLLAEGGGVAEALLDVTREGDATMLCMATRSRGAVAEALLGSVSEAVMRRSPVPVILVGPRAQPPAEPLTHLLVGIDGSDVADDALDVASALASRLDVDLKLIQVLEPDLRLPEDVTEDVVLRRAATRLPASRTDWDVLRDDHPARAIVDAAAALPSCMIVVGTHGRSGLRRAVAGSVALDVVRRSPVPVMVVTASAVQRDRSEVGQAPDAAVAGGQGWIDVPGGVGGGLAATR